MKALPLKHWLALEDDVNRHRAEIAQQFAEARVRLLLSGPVPAPVPWSTLRVGDRVTFGFEPWRPWHQRMWRRIRASLGYTYPPQVFTVTSVTDGAVSIGPR